MGPKKPPINFTKMQAAGNDFIIIDNRNKALSRQKIIGITPQICRRHFGIGADGIIALQPAQPEASVDYSMFYRNADGSDAGMCGNGARCLALFAVVKLGFNANLSFVVHDTVYKAEVSENNQVRIHFPESLSIETVKIDNQEFLKLYTGTEHLVKEVSEVDLKNKDKLRKQGRRLRKHPALNPPGTNVNFIHDVSKNTLFLRTYERGVEDLTLACGTGAVASALAWHKLQNSGGNENQSMSVQTDGGRLQVGFRFDEDKKTYDNITLSGKAKFVFEGRYEI